MASKSKVNVRFVVTLSLVLSAGAIGLLAAAFFVLTHSAAELEATGDQKMKEGNFKDAITYYGKAFNEDQASVDRLRKYCNAMLAYTPENQALYGDYYWKRYLPAKRALAGLLKNDVGEQKEVLEILTRNMYQSGYDRRNWDQVIDIANTSIAPFEAGAPAQGWQILKRYRVLAWVEIASNEPSLDDQQTAQIEADFKEVLALDPNDEHISLAQVSWYNLNAGKALTAGRTTDEADWRAKAQSALDAYRAAHPDSVEAAMTAVAYKVEAAARAADPKNFSPEQRLKIMNDAAAKLQPEVAALIELIRRVGPETIDPGLLYRMSKLEQFAYNGKHSDALELVNKAIEKAPGKAELRFMAGRLLEEKPDYDGAIAQYAALLEIPIPPLSLDGVMLYQERRAAMVRRAEAAMGIWESRGRPDQGAEPTAEQKAAQKTAQAEALAQVEHFRDDLVKEVPPDDLDLLLINAKIDYASDKLTDAQTKLQSHLSQTNQSDPDSVRLAGIVAIRLNQPGVARDLFVRLIELDPKSPRAHMLKGDVEGMLENHQAALQDYQEVLALVPDDAYAKDKVQQLTQLINRTSDDPVKQMLLRADALWNGAGVSPDKGAAVALLEQGLADPKFHDNVLLIRMLSTYYYNLARGDEARALCARGLALEPGNKELQNLYTILQAKDQYEAGIQLIDASPAAPIEKLIAKLQLAKRFNRTEDATRFLAAAVELSPDSPAVIEFRFTDAIARGKLEEAAKFADRATELDVDKLKGATYRARILVANNDKAGAIAVLKLAVQGGGATPEVWRFLGQVQADLGEETKNNALVDDALASLNESLRMRPNDLGTLTDTLKTLVHLGRYEPALDLARKNEALGRSSPEFRDLWLRLEASAGDKERVIQVRRAMLREQPDNDINKLALLQADIDLAQWDEARMLLDQLRAKPDQAGNAVLLAQLDARWYSSRGEQDSARKVYLDFIAAQKAAGKGMGPEAYVAMAQFLIGIGDTAGGLAALEEGRNYQDPKTLDVDRSLAMALFDLGRLDEALPIFEKFLAAKVPDDFPAPFAVRAKYTEALLRLSRFDDAEKALNAAGADGNSSITLVLLRAGARQGLKDDAGALKIVNDAIVKFPSEPLGYVKRAELTSGSAESVGDAIADLDTAIRLKPDLWNALQLRALLKIRQNRQEEAMDDLRAVVKGNPTAPGPRTALLQALIESDQFEEALSTANFVANQRPRDVALLMNLGDLFNSYSSQKPDALGAAARFYDRAWKLGPNPAVAIIYTRALLKNRGNKQVQDLVEQILGTPELKTDENPELLMNRAILYNSQTKFDLSRADAARALQLVIKNPGDTSVMLDQLTPVFGDPSGKSNVAALIDFVQHLDMTGLPDLWAEFFRARFKFLDPQGQQDALNSLRHVVDNAKDPTLQKVARQFLSAALIGSGDKAAAQGDTATANTLYEEAFKVINGALALDPDNAEALNNGAYVLAENLKRPAEALPLAEHAVEVMPNAGAFWDTLGLIYFELGRFDDAEKALNRAVNAGGSVEDRMQIAIKLVRVKIAKKDHAAAQKILDDANKATGRIPRLKQAYQAQLDALQKDVDAIR